MASKLFANILAMGSVVLGRTLLRAYHKALANAAKSGLAQETVQNIRSKVMAESEARQILGVAENSTWEEIMRKYDNLFDKNAVSGSFYVQSKVHRAKECLEAINRKQYQEAYKHKF